MLGSKRICSDHSFAASSQEMAHSLFLFRTTIVSATKSAVAIASLVYRSLRLITNTDHLQWERQNCLKREEGDPASFQSTNIDHLVIVTRWGWRECVWRIPPVSSANSTSRYQAAHPRVSRLMTFVRSHRVSTAIATRRPDQIPADSVDYDKSKQERNREQGKVASESRKFWANALYRM